MKPPSTGQADAVDVARGVAVQEGQGAGLLLRVERRLMGCMAASSTLAAVADSKSFIIGSGWGRA